MRTPIFVTLAGVTFACVVFAQSQSQVPVVVPVAAPQVASKPAAVSSNPDSAAVLKALQEMKTANEETLKKQTSALQQLEELEKVAEQIRLYTRRS